MSLRHGVGLATGKTAVQITALLVGQLLLAGFKPGMVVSTDQAPAARFAPLSFVARLRQGVSHRGELRVHRTRAGFIDLGCDEIVLRELEESHRDHATRRRWIAARAVTRGEQAGDEDGDHEGRARGRCWWG